MITWIFAVGNFASTVLATAAGTPWSAFSTSRSVPSSRTPISYVWPLCFSMS